MQEKESRVRGKSPGENEKNPGKKRARAEQKREKSPKQGVFQSGEDEIQTEMGAENDVFSDLESQSELSLAEDVLERSAVHIFAKKREKISSNLTSASRANSKHAKSAKNATFELFLAHLSLVSNLSWATNASGLTMQEVRAKRDAEPEFDSQCIEAIDLSIARGEAEVTRRGQLGTREAIYHQGQVVGFKQVYSDKLLLASLGAHDARYRRSQGMQDSPQDSQHVTGVLRLAAPQSAEEWEESG